MYLLPLYNAVPCNLCKQGGHEVNASDDLKVDDFPCSLCSCHALGKETLCPLSTNLYLVTGEPLGKANKMLG